jgi:uncharacterized iron-regulated membrane protein
MNFRTYVRKIHFYIGLWLGLLFVVLGLTGSLLVFKESLTGLFHPNKTIVKVQDQRAGYETLLDDARTTYPDQRVDHIKLPDYPSDAAELWVGDGTIRFYGNVYTGELLGKRNMNWDVMGIVHSLHIELLGGSLGRTILGVTGLIYLVLLGTGLVLWWPGWAHFRRGITMRWSTNFRSLNYQSHELTGFYTSVFLLFLVLTGVGLCFYGTSRSLLEGMFGGGTKTPPVVASATETTLPEENPSVDRFLRKAQNRFPDSEMTWVHLPYSADSPLTVRFRTTWELHPDGNSKLYFHPATGEPLEADLDHEREWGIRLYRMLYPLHGGLFWGTLMDILMVLLGLVPLVLFTTGVTIWWKRGGS